MMPDLMEGLEVHHIRFKAQAINPIQFADQAGSAIRGALYESLSRHFCTKPREQLMVDHDKYCPVCWLLDAEDETAIRGRDMPRALAIQPPLKDYFKKGEIFVFGLTLIGQARSLTIHLLRSVMQMGELGIGRGRGKFKLLSVSEHNPLLDAERRLLDGNTLKQSTLFVNSYHIAESVRRMWKDRITIKFLTPLRIISQKQVVKQPDPLPFIQRLLERCQSLLEYYSEGERARPSRETWKDRSFELSERAAKLNIAYNETQWIEAWSGSKRQEKYTPISGLIGVTRWEGDVEPFLPWLLWGQSLHVGKNAVKGNGWYQIIQ